MIAIHYALPNFSGPSLTLAGTDCAGGGITLTGGAWDNRIDSTANGCSRIEHYDISEDFVFEGEVNITAGSGGNLGTLRNRTSGILYKGSLAAKVNLVGMEVNQGIQDLENSVELVRQRPTIVRAFIDPTGTATTAAVGRLYLDRSDGSTLGPLLPLNSGGRMLASGNALDRRNELGSSLNFRLPAGWTLGTGTLRLEILGGGANCLEEAPPANTCTAEVSFTEVETPRVRFVGIETTNGNPTNAELEEQAARFLSGLPVSSLDVDYRVLNTSTVFDSSVNVMNDANEALLNARTNDGSTNMYLGVMNGSGMGGGKSAGIPANAAVWYMGPSSAGITEGGYARNRGPHEFGHAIGARHSSDADDETVCSDKGPQNAPLYPFLEAVDGEEVAALGPLGDPQTEAWGLDYRFFTDTSSSLGIVSPLENFSLMSYCGNDSTFVRQNRWVDSFHWPRFIDLINGYDWSQGVIEDDSNWWDIFTGTLIFADDGSVESMSFAPATAMPLNHQPGIQPTGDYVLELVNAGGAVVVTRPFEPYVLESDQGEDGSEASDAAIFSIAVDGQPDYAQAVVRLDGTVLGSFDRSVNPPSVAVTAPTAGAVLDGGQVAITWTATDDDGDDLYHTVQYSTDGGTIYETIAVEYTGDSITLDRDDLVGSNQARVRVITSDGTRSAIAESEVFVVADNAPRVSIVSPDTGSVFTDLQAVVLDATAFDIEDGVLSEGSIGWSSDIEGFLGTGTTLMTEAALLTPGTHQVMVTATDSAGNATTALVEIVIGHTNSAPAPVDDNAYAEVGDSIDIDVLANDLDPEGDLVPETLQIVEGPINGIAIVVDDPEAGPVIRFESATDGTDSITYEVCDSNGQCGTAVVTIVVGTSDCTILGTNAADTLVGTDGDDIICGLGGGDIIEGGGGDDIIRGGRGADTIEGGDGNDRIHGGRGTDTIDGGGGDDIIRGGRGADTIDGGDGSDEIHGGQRADTINGGNGNDVIFAGAGADSVSGGNHADVIHGNRGQDTINGERGSDELYGGRGADVITGGRGSDFIAGRAGNDELRGNQGNDTIRGGRGDDLMYGGSGADDLAGGRGNDYANGGAGNDECRAEQTTSC